MQRIWQWKFASPPAAIWPSMADTAPLQRSGRSAQARDHRDPASRRLRGLRRPAAQGAGHHRMAGASGQLDRRAVVRALPRFPQRPVPLLCATFELTPEGGGSRGIYKLEAVPSGILWVGSCLLAGGFLQKAGRTFAKLAAEADSYRPGPAARALRLRPAGAGCRTTQGRVAQMVKAIEATPNGHGLARSSPTTC